MPAGCSCSTPPTPRSPTRCAPSSTGTPATTASTPAACATPRRRSTSGCRSPGAAATTSCSPRTATSAASSTCSAPAPNPPATRSPRCWRSCAGWTARPGSARRSTASPTSPTCAAITRPPFAIATPPTRSIAAIGDDERLATGLARRAIGAINAGAPRRGAARRRRGSADRRSRRELVAHRVGQRGRRPPGDGDGRHRRRPRRPRRRRSQAYEAIGTDHDRCAVHLDLAAGALIAGELDRAAAELRLGLPALAEAGVDRFVADGLDLAAALIAPGGRRLGGADRRHRRRVPSGQRRRRIGRPRNAASTRWAPAARARLGAEWERIWSSTPPAAAGDELADATEVAMGALARRRRTPEALRCSEGLGEQREGHGRDAGDLAPERLGDRRREARRACASSRCRDGCARAATVPRTASLPLIVQATSTACTAACIASPRGQTDQRRRRASLAPVARPARPGTPRPARRGAADGRRAAGPRRRRARPGGTGRRRTPAAVPVEPGPRTGRALRLDRVERPRPVPSAAAASVGISTAKGCSRKIASSDHDGAPKCVVWSSAMTAASTATSSLPVPRIPSVSQVSMIVASAIRLTASRIVGPSGPDHRPSVGIADEEPADVVHRLAAAAHERPAARRGGSRRAPVRRRLPARTTHTTAGRDR